MFQSSSGGHLLCFLEACHDSALFLSLFLSFLCLLLLFQSSEGHLLCILEACHDSALFLSLFLSFLCLFQSSSEGHLLCFLEACHDSALFLSLFLSFLCLLLLFQSSEGHLLCILEACHDSALFLAVCACHYSAGYYPGYIASFLFAHCVSEPVGSDPDETADSKG
uniref:Uncharacterized protein n=1 Tax=Cacopsylla melanoneura TaxID=428564 RepID=A0A8D8X450_9HEMI